MHEIKNCTKNTNETQTASNQRDFTASIDDDVDGDDTNSNVEEPVKAKIRREPSRQGA